jgi:hypothetical protein
LVVIKCRLAWPGTITIIRRFHVQDRWFELAHF